MNIQRRAAPPESSSDDDDDEDDVFSALSHKQKKKEGNSSATGGTNKIGSTSTGGLPVQPQEVKAGEEKAEENNDSKSERHDESTSSIINNNVNINNKSQSPASLTSSMKRHHGMSSARKAKMDALLQELNEEKEHHHHQQQQQQHKQHDGTGGYYGPNHSRPSSSSTTSSRSGTGGGGGGSYVEPGTEHLTTNIFVGNLSPTITEEELTDLFRQFGDLYSVKIMWPRTPEEKARNRNTGFVCFMERADAEDAMEACSDADPFNCGRRMKLNWGKNVKKIVKRTPGTALTPRHRSSKRQRSSQAVSSSSNGDRKGTQTEEDKDAIPTETEHGTQKKESGDSTMETDKSPPKQQQQPQATQPRADGPSEYDPEIHGSNSIQVVLPADLNKVKWIDRVAAFVAKDGSDFERSLMERETNNPNFSFLFHSLGPGETEDEETRKERIYYRWKVYSIAQGDWLDSWRTEPFVMFQRTGRYWIPPPMDHDENRDALDGSGNSRESVMPGVRKRTYNLLPNKRRAVHRRPRRSDGSNVDNHSNRLSDRDLDEFNVLSRKKLCNSKMAICKAMAFCFDRSNAAEHISGLLKELLLESQNNVSMETRIARLYLMSDILFNSQQPGVKNAFRYRDSIERMAPEVFASLGKYGKGTLGRLSLNKLKVAVTSVLAAWANWSVYNPAFLDELQDRFEGKEPKKEDREAHNKNEEKDESLLDASDIKEETPQTKSILGSRGDWTDVVATEEEEDVQNDADDLDGEELDGNDMDDIIIQVPTTKNGDDVTIPPDLIDPELDGESLEEGDLDYDDFPLKNLGVEGIIAKDMQEHG